MGWEDAKADRRLRIVDAAEALVMRTGSTDFGVRELADVAGISTPTIYNLIGPKSEVLYAVLNRFQGRMEQARVRGGNAISQIGKMLQATDIATDMYVKESRMLVPLLRFLLSVKDSTNRSQFMARAESYWRECIHDVFVDSKPGHIPIDALSRDCLYYFTGLVEFWVHEAMSDESFVIRSRIGMILRILAFADGADRKFLIEELDCQLSALT